MNNQLSVVHVANVLGLGGTQKGMEVFVRNLDETKHDVAVCGYKNGGERGESLEADGYPVYEPSSKAAFADVLRNRDVDIVHLHGMYDTTAEAVDVSKRVGVDSIVRTTPFGRLAEGTPDAVDLTLFPSKMTLLRRIKLDQYSVNSFPNCYRVQYNPLSVSDVSNRLDDDFRDELDIQPTTPVIGKIGRSAAAKWSQTSLDSFESICTRHPETRILLVNPPDKIQTEISRRGLEQNVETIDSIPLHEVGKFYNTIDVLTHASAIGESFGYVIAEAMAYRTPVVVDSNPMRDNAQVELVSNGETGYVVGSSEAYADATVELLQSDELRHEFATAAQQRATNLFDPSPIVDKLEKIYRVLYESNSDSGALADELESQHTMAAFEREYRNRLYNLYGSESLRHRLERSTWRLCSDILPSYRDTAYHTFQGLFKNI